MHDRYKQKLERGVQNNALSSMFRPKKLRGRTIGGIPRIIHQIWLGPPMPKIFEKFRETWSTIHPSWKMVLWNEQNLPETRNRDLFEEATNYGEKSDILRYDLIYKYGGVYVDIDFECLKDIEPLLGDATLAVDECQFDGRIYELEAGAGLFGATPEHQFLDRVTRNLKEHYRKYRGQSIPHKTGPFFFNDQFKNFQDRNKTTILPGKFFYPFAWFDNHARTGEIIKHKRQFDSKKCPDAYAIHHYAASWL